MATCENQAKPVVLDALFVRPGRGIVDGNVGLVAYFLQRVVPVANEYKVRLACHPHDPGMPPEGYRGVDRVLGTVDGLKKFLSIQESPYHGLNFCQGTLAENLRDPGKEILDVIRYFGSRKKIFISIQISFGSAGNVRMFPTREWNGQ